MKEIIDNLVTVTEIYYDKWYIHIALAVMIALFFYTIYKVILK